MTLDVSLCLLLIEYNISGIIQNLWSYVSSVENPADIASRGATAHELKNGKLRFNGPTFLWTLSEPFKSPTTKTPALLENDPEVKRSSIRHHLHVRNQCNCQKWSTHSWQNPWSRISRSFDAKSFLYNEIKGDNTATRLFQGTDMCDKKRWRRVQHLANEFWTRWKREIF